MKKKKKEGISRRKFIPLAASGMLLPFLGYGGSALENNKKKSTHPKEDDEYATMLTPNGDVVKVKRTALKKAKVVEKNLSNKSLLNWLKPKKSTKS